MNCAEFTNWLDTGAPAEAEPRARAHASGCERCAALLRAQSEIDAALRREPSAPPLDRARFVARVMERVEAAPRPVLRPIAPPLPWWAQAAADPAAALACGLIALLLWRPDAVSVAGRFLAGRWTLLSATAFGEARARLGLDRPLIATGFGILGLLLLAWISFELYRWTERVARRSARA